MNDVTEKIEKRLVRYGDLLPCKTAFIDAHTPGSDQKRKLHDYWRWSFRKCGSAYTHKPSSRIQYWWRLGNHLDVEIRLHSHRTAEVFFVLSGRWRFFWGRWGKAGEVILEAGDIFNIPTGIFRGFENIGTDYGMIMAILGGDDAGGGVIWAPQVIEDASDHGLILSEKGRLYDTKKGQALPPNEKPMPKLTHKELLNYPEPSTSEVVPNHVARYWDMVALSHTCTRQSYR